MGNFYIVSVEKKPKHKRGKIKVDFIVGEIRGCSDCSLCDESFLDFCDFCADSSPEVESLAKIEAPGYEYYNTCPLKYYKE